MVNKHETNAIKRSRMRYFIIALAFVVTVGISSLAYTQNANNQDDDASGFMDPFTFQMLSISINNAPSVASLSYLVVTRPPIRIPYKPDFRSQYKPWSDGSDINWSW